MVAAVVTMENDIQFATGALNTFVFTLTGSAVYDLSTYRPKGFKIISITANFASATNVDATNGIVVDVSNEKVSVYTGTSVETEAFSLSAVALAKKSGGSA